MRLWNKTQEKLFFINSLKASSPGQLFYRDENGKTQLAHVSIRCACGESSQNRDECREGSDSRAGFGDKGCSDEGHKDAEPFDLVGLFFQDEDGHQYGKKRRELVQYISIRDVHVVNCPEIAEDSCSSDTAA